VILVVNLDDGLAGSALSNIVQSAFTFKNGNEQTRCRSGNNLGANGAIRECEH
jgi:hypothetical protein